MTRTIILDRDGVINYDSAEYIKSPDEWRPIPGSLEAIARLNKEGFQVLVVTNQSGISRGYYDELMLHKIHDKLYMELEKVGGQITEIFFCPHQPLDQCECRKPKPGLVHQIQQKYAIDLKNTFFIGDSLSDMEVALNAGCKPILVLTGNGEKTLRENPDLSVIHFANLATATEYVLTCPINYTK